MLTQLKTPDQTRPKHRPWWLPRAVIAAAVGGLLLALALIPGPTRVRIERINRLIAEGKLGLYDHELSPRIAAQFTWLARYAGVRDRVVVDGPIAPDQLTFVVTNPAYQDVTHCGPVTPSTIHRSKRSLSTNCSCVPPRSMSSVRKVSNSMFSMHELPFVTSYLNFIVAHELGHWQKHDHAAAFFYYGWNEGTASLGEEKEADASAVRTLLRARIAGDIPEGVERNNAIFAAGIDDKLVAPDQRATADIVGGVLMLVETAMFSSSPFSPYYSDDSHPSLVARVRSAVDTIQSTTHSTLPPVAAQIVAAEVRRFSALSDWRHRELMLPGPLQKASVRAGALWIGRTDIPDPNADATQEQLYRIPLLSLMMDRGYGAFEAPRPIATGYSKVGEAYNYAEGLGAWVDGKFEAGDLAIGLPGQIEPLGIKGYPIWSADHQGASVEIGTTWSISDTPSMRGGELASPALRAAVQAKLDSTDVEIGPPLLRDGRNLRPRPRTRSPRPLAVPRLSDRVGRTARGGGTRGISFRYQCRTRHRQHGPSRDFLVGTVARQCRPGA